MKVAIYLRSATESQVGPNAISAQRALAERYCFSKDFTISQFYSDCCVSGLLPLDQRPGGSQLLKDAQSGRFEQIVVCHIDRIARDLPVLLAAAKALEDYGVGIRIVDEDFTR